MRCLRILSPSGDGSVKCIRILPRAPICSEDVFIA